MRLFIDCEYNGWRGTLISMALVPEQGEPFYQVLRLDGVQPTPWVRENVLSVLSYTGEEIHPVTLSTFSSLLQKYLSQWKEVTVVANWPDDIKYFCEVITPSPNTLINVPLLNFEIRTVKIKSEIPHNALADALALRNAGV